MKKSYWAVVFFFLTPLLEQMVNAFGIFGCEMPAPDGAPRAAPLPVPPPPHSSDAPAIETTTTTRSRRR
jgi:hypothetical protein